MDLGLRGKAVLVTGGSRGIGRAIALAFAAEGANVAICGRTREPLDRTLSELRGLGAKSIAIAIDLEEEGAPARMVNEAAAAFGALHILVNNASSNVGRAGTFEETPDGIVFQRVTGKGFGAIRCTRAALPHMRNAGWGRVIFIGGTSARTMLRPWELPSTGSGLPHGMGNALVSNFARHLSLEVAGANILVNVVHPHLTRTDKFPRMLEMTMQERGIDKAAAEKALGDLLPIGRPIEPSEVANLVTFLASELASGISGQSIAVDGAAGGHIPY